MPLHQQAREFLDALAEQGAPAWNEMTPAAARTMFADLTPLFGSGPELHQVKDDTVGNHVPVRIYYPTDEVDRPAVIYFHGGGWVLGDLNTHDALCRRIAKESDCVVVSVDYRRSPEHRHPAALEDCFSATLYIAENSSDSRIDSDNIFVMGDSAGGHLAAATALKAREESGPTIRGQILIYPITDMRFDTSSYTDFANDYGLTIDSMKWFWQQYLGDDLEIPDQYAVPNRAESLVGLPPAHVVTAEYDVLRDEGEDFAARLRDARVPVTTKRYDGMIHGFVHFAGTFDDARRAVLDVSGVLKSLQRK